MLNKNLAETIHVSAVDERRKCARFIIGAEVKCESAHFRDDELVGAVDLSFMGTRLYVTGNIPWDAEIPVVFHFPESGYHFRARGNAVWERRVDTVNNHQVLHEVGIKFSAVNDSDKENFYRYVNRSCNKELVKKWWGDCR